MNREEIIAKIVELEENREAIYLDDHVDEADRELLAEIKVELDRLCAGGRIDAGSPAHTGEGRGST